MLQFVSLFAVLAILQGCTASRGVTYEMPGAIGHMNATKAEQTQLELVSRGHVQAPDSRTDKPLKLLRAPQPVMPAEEIARGTGGSVTAAVRFAENGEPEAVMVRSSTSDLLGGAVVSAMWQWRIEPATRDRKPVKLTVVQTFSFRFAP